MRTHRSLLRMFLAAAVLLGFAEAVGAQHKTWYLAEGASNDFFEEEILITNPNAGPARVDVTFLRADGSEVKIERTIPATSRYTLRVGEVSGLQKADASAVVTSDVDILVERSQYWPGPLRRDGHNAAGVPAPAPRWFLAEGALGFTQTFVLIANPSPTQAEVRVTYLRTGGAPPIVKAYSVPGRSRQTIWVNKETPDAGEFATIVESTNGVGIIVERAMYWKDFEGGHAVAGVTEPSPTWRFAEGFTGNDFVTFLLLANPTAQAAEVRVTWLFDDGTAPLVQEWDVAAMSRLTIGAHTFPALRNRAFSILVESTNGVPTVAERAMYFDDLRGGHSAVGVTAASTRWGFAEGLDVRPVGEALTYLTFYLLANATDQPAHVTATFYREDGTGVTRTLTVFPHSRATLVSSDVRELRDHRFGAIFASTNDVPIVVERAVYWGRGAGPASAGHASAGTAWTGAIAAPPAPPTMTITGLSVDEGPLGTEVDIFGTGFVSGFVFVEFGGVITAPPWQVVSPTQVRVRVNWLSEVTAPVGPLDVTVKSGGPNNIVAVLPRAFTILPGPLPAATRTPDPVPGPLHAVPAVAPFVP